MKPINCRSFGLFDNLFKRKTQEDKPKESNKEETEANTQKEK